jgi:hypothetical protein
MAFWLSCIVPDFRLCWVMAKSMNYQVAPEAGDRIRATSWSPASVAGQMGHGVNWTFGAASDREPGNACIGIAVGCALSLPIWAGIVLAWFVLF